MYVQFCPPSPKAGQQEHVSQTTAAALIAAGLAREIVLSDEEKKRIRFGVPKSVPLPEVKWNVIESPHTGALLIQRRFGTDTTLFTERPGKQWNCPPEIVKEFEARLERERLARVAAKQNRDRAAESILR